MTGLPTVVHTATKLRALQIIDASFRATGQPVSDENLYRLDYFVDAFARLWKLEPLDRFRDKVDEPRSLAIRTSLDRLVVAGLVLPRNVRLVGGAANRLTADYVLDQSTATPVLRAGLATKRGVREASLVDEVVFAAASILDEDFDDALHLDAGFSDERVGNRDVLDLSTEDPRSTSAVASEFEGAVRSKRHREAELTHIYLSHLERILRNDD